MDMITMYGQHYNINCLGLVGVIGINNWYRNNNVLTKFDSNTSDISEETWSKEAGLQIANNYVEI